MKLTVEQKVAFANAILWRQGSGTVTFDCNDEGFFTMECAHAEAQTEFFTADDPERLALLVVEADKKAA